MQKPTTTCGGRDILQSFGTDFLSDIFEKRSKDKDQPVREAVTRREPLKAAEQEKEYLSMTPKIMASYDSISVSSQTHPQLRSEEESQPGCYRSLQDREDGADSIVEDECVAS